VAVGLDLVVPSAGLHGNSLLEVLFCCFSFLEWCRLLCVGGALLVRPNQERICSQSLGFFLEGLDQFGREQHPIVDTGQSCVAFIERGIGVSLVDGDNDALAVHPMQDYRRATLPFGTGHPVQEHSLSDLDEALSAPKPALIDAPDDAIHSDLLSHVRNVSAEGVRVPVNRQVALFAQPQLLVVEAERRELGAGDPGLEFEEGVVIFSCFWVAWKLLR
jgi:hypothetical protein